MGGREGQLREAKGDYRFGCRVSHSEWAKLVLCWGRRIYQIVAW